MKLPANARAERWIPAFVGMTIGLFLMLATLPAAAQLMTPATSTAPAVNAPPARLMMPKDIAVLQVLDKVSARVTTLRVPVGSSAAFGLIFVTVRSCQIAPPSEPPEAAAFLEISEVDIRSLPRSGGANGVTSATSTQRLLFSGWMFASSPALSPLEHPTYDIIVLGCESRTPTPAEAAAAGEEGGAAPAASTAPATSSAPSSVSPAESPPPED